MGRLRFTLRPGKSRPRRSASGVFSFGALSQFVGIGRVAELASLNVLNLRMLRSSAEVSAVRKRLESEEIRTT